MTGANYMGGKRNAARARTKDSTSRVQKRHFGQQRLAAALCNTREERGKPEKMSLKSVLHQINLAHAQRDAKIKGSHPSLVPHTSTSCDLSSAHGPSFSSLKRRKQPSKILRTLDLSDPVAYRDAIDRILSIPLSEMIGLPLQGKSPHAEDGGPDIDPDAQFQGASNDIFSHTGRSSESASHLFPMDNDDDGRIYDDHFSGRTSQPPSPDHCTATIHESPLRCIEDGLQESWVNDSGYADMDTAETGNRHGFTLTHDLLDPQRYSLSPSNSFPFSFGSISQGTEEQILDMDTSPPSSQNSFSQLRGGWSSNHEHFLQRSPSSPTSPITSSALIPESFRWNSVECSSPISQSLFHTSDVKQFSASSCETQYAPTTSQNTQKIFHDARNSEAVEKSFAEISNTGHCRPFQTSYSVTPTEPAESHSFNSWHDFSSFRDSDTHDPCLPLDILNDPDPWATIGRILNLEIVEEHDNDDVNFTRGREGVGYVRHRLDETAHVWNPPRNSTIRLGSIKSESEDQSKAMMNNEVEEHLGEPTDHCFYQSQHSQVSQSEERPSPDHSIIAKDMKFADQNESLCALTVAESEVLTESRCNPATPTHRVPPQDVQCSGIDDDMYGGPCLFEDSDSEEDR